MKNFPNRIRQAVFPLSTQEAFVARCLIAAELKGRGFSIFAIRQVLRCELPDEARRLADALRGVSA